jgi:acetyl-CoA C-acetyltransferase
MPNAVIVEAVRTPIGKFQGALAGHTAPQLGAHAIRALLERAKLDPKLVDEVFMGNVLTAGVGQNPARQAALGAGLPSSVAALTVNKVCGSGLKAVVLAAQAIKAGDITVAVSGGQESMTNAPYLLPAARAGIRLGHGEIVDSMIWDGLWDKYNDYHMGMTAELVADEYKVSRADQDAFAVESHRRAVAAAAAGKFRDEIAPVTIPQRKGDPVVVAADEGPRADSTMESLAKMKPAFKKDGGSVTAGNASSINDGASALLVMEEERAKALGMKPMARIVGYATGGVDPKWVMMAPEKAVQQLNAKLGVDIGHYDLIELNEAFAVAAVALTRVLKIDPAKINVNGGAVALGHPIGASGARILTTLLHELRRSGKRRGLAGLCLGGGNAVAMAVEMV